MPISIPIFSMEIVMQHGSFPADARYVRLSRCCRSWQSHQAFLVGPVIAARAEHAPYRPSSLQSGIAARTAPSLRDLFCCTRNNTSTAHAKHKPSRRSSPQPHRQTPPLRTARTPLPCLNGRNKDDNQISNRMMGFRPPCPSPLPHAASSDPAAPSIISRDSSRWQSRARF